MPEYIYLKSKYHHLKLISHQITLAARLTRMGNHTKTYGNKIGCR
jgi:hypothetical protein